MSLLTSIGSVFGRTIREAWAGGTGMVLPVGFLFGACTLVPLTTGAQTEIYQPLATGLIWLFIALAALLLLERLFQSDLEDGSLDQLRLSPLPMELVCLTKVIALWTVAMLPMLAVLPLAGLLIGADPMTLALSLPVYAMGGLTFFLWGGVGAALTAGIRRSGLLIALIVLPLFAPAVIFGAEAVQIFASGGSAISAPLLFLAAATLMAVAIAPLAMALALKFQGEA